MPPINADTGIGLVKVYPKDFPGGVISVIRVYQSQFNEISLVRVFVPGPQGSQGLIGPSSDAATGSFALKTDISGAFNGVTGSFVTNSQTSSFVINSQTSSFVRNIQTGSFAITGSNIFKSKQFIYGGGTNGSKSGSLNLMFNHASGGFNGFTGSNENGVMIAAMYSASQGTPDFIDLYEPEAGDHWFRVDGQGKIYNGEWRATVISPTYGGTGVDNGIKTISTDGNITFNTNASAMTFNSPASVNITLPTTGELAVVTNISGAFSSVSASITNNYLLASATASYVRNVSTGGFATTGSNVFKSNQIISGSVDITGSSFQYNNNNVLTSNQTSSFALSANISGAFTTVSSSLSSRTTTLENTTLLSSVTSSYTPNSLTGSFALKTNITGAFSTDSSSFGGRITVLENLTTGSYVKYSDTASMLQPYLLSSGTSSFALKTDISGAFTLLSSSIQSRVTSTENTKLDSSFTGSLVQNSSTSSFAIKTEISGAFTLTSSSLASRSTILENTKLDSSYSASIVKYSDTSSMLSPYALIVNVTGSTTAFSSSITTRITTIESIENDLMTATSSYALKTNITGAFTSLSQSITNNYLPLTGGTITGNVTVTGTASIALLYTMYSTSSVIYQSGSTKFGDTMDDNHSYTGSLAVTGSGFIWNTWTVVTSNDTGSFAFKTNITGAFSLASSSLGSRIAIYENVNVLSGSAQIASNISGAFTLDSSSFSTRATVLENTKLNSSITSSLSYLTDIAGYATTGSNTFSGNQQITGSVNITGSLLRYNNNNVLTSNDTASFALIVNISGSFISLSSSLAGRITTDETIQSSILSATSSYALKTDITGSSTVLSSSISGRVTTLEAASTTYALSTQITGFATTGSNTFKSNQVISGSVDITGSSFQWNYNNILTSNQTSSFALTSNISGSITSFSSSITTRLTSVESIETSLMASTSSYASKTDISGAFIVASGGLAGRINTLETAGYALATQLTGYATTGSNVFKAGQTISGSVDITGSLFQFNYNNVLTSNQTSSFALSANISGAFTLLSSSFASRITSDESVITDILTGTSSFALKTSVSGAFTTLSSSFAGRITTDESVISDILTATSSYALKVNISGSNTAFSSSATTRITTLENSGYVTNAQTGGYSTTGSNTYTGTQTVTNMTLATNGQILLTVPTANSQSTGPTINAFNVGYATSSVGDLVYLDVNAAWQKTDANTTTLYNGLLGVSLAVATSASALLVALPGSIIFCNAFPTFTIGGPIYMSETAGVVTQTQPTTTDAAIRVIGWGIHANKMYFNPSQDYITHV